MIDILYIIGEPSINKDQELKYSLRSLEKYVSDFNRIFITGKCPDFIDKSKVIFTPEKDIGMSTVNHWWKVNQTITQTDISEDFVLMYDDIFFIKPTKLENYPFYQKGYLGESTEGGKLYCQTLRNALEWLIRKRLPFVDYEVHTPFIYNKKNFLKLYDIFKAVADLNLRYGQLVPRSIYGNLFIKEEQPLIKDVKIRSKDEEIPTHLDCFSVSDLDFKYKTLEYLEQEFKNKSRWEK